MALSEGELRALLGNPSESLDIELKRWIDPATADGIAKIVKGCIALRNNNGGKLIIGFTDAGQPDLGQVPANVRDAFHVDVVQGFVGKYSSELFPVEVQFGEREGTCYPVITVPSGVRSPVTAKRNIGPPDKPLVKDHAVYVRSLSSNNTVSSSEARRGDWERLIQMCFDNREADIGAFVRRHLTGVNLGQLALLLSGSGDVTVQTVVDRAREMLSKGRKRFRAEAKKRQVEVPQVGFREVGVVIDGDAPEHRATDRLLQQLFVVQPRHTGWPAWVDCRRFSRATDQPYVYKGKWEAFLIELDEGPFIAPHIDFWLIDPRGRFYQSTAYEDDLRQPVRAPEPGTQLDFLLQISRVAEIISVALSFGRSMEFDSSKSSLAFAFHWSSRSGRHLTSWVEPMRSFGARRPARQSSIVTNVTVPLDTPRSAIATHVNLAVRDLFALFGGMEFDSQVINRIVEGTLQIRS
jgi:hypothetical protein